MKTTTAKTAQQLRTEGANKERTAWLAYSRRREKVWKRNGSAGWIVANELWDAIAWGLQRNERYNARKGGLGK